MQKPDDNPMYKAHTAPRCTATSKRTSQPCKAPAVRGWTVCRFHGARGGHVSGSSHPTWKHGARSREAVETRKLINDLARQLRELQTLIEPEPKA